MKKLILILILLFPVVTFAAWVATDNFESYADGNNLDGLSGGSGWTGNWAETSAGKYKITNTDAKTGSLSMRYNSYDLNGDESEASRAFTTVNDGSEVQFYIKKTNSFTADNTDVYFYNSSNSMMYVGFAASTGILRCGRNGGEDTLVASPNLNQWYKINIKFSNTSYTIDVDDAGFSAAKDYVSARSGGVNTVKFRIGAANNADYYFYVDDIGTLAAPASPVGLVLSYFSDWF